ncbi:MAG: hypothetical protein K8R36_02390 [Planctomycetales bacterium]|nr:hypothetical protein [Planctomycetales bacterium]
MNTTKTLRFLPATFGVLAILATAAFPMAGRAEDPSPKCRVCVAQEKAVPVLSQIPYLGRFFKTVTHQEVERVGVDFDFEICPDCPQACKGGVAAGVCQSTAGPKLFVIRKTANGQMTATCCNDEPSCGKDEPGCGKDEPCCGKECAAATACCEKGCEIICEEDECQGLTWERVIELTAKSAALEAVLEAHEAFDEEKSSLIETLAMSMVEKAKLEGKVEALTQQAELTKEMLTLVSENARLKAQAEMAEVKFSMLQEMAKLAKENEQLKLSTRTRAVPAQLSSDVEYLPPSTHKQPARSAPAKKATFQDDESSLGEAEAKQTR